MKVSVLILAFNEAANLPACLTALSWCDDIVVLDSGSTDATLEIARAAGARILERHFDNFAQQRNYGLDQGRFRHDWILHLDADEVVTPAFTAAISALSPPGGILAYRVPSKTMFHGQWLRHAGMYPTYQVRLGRRDRLRFIQVGHGQREDLPAEAIGQFNEPYLHFNFSHGLAAWLRKHVRYAEDEARTLLAERDNLVMRPEASNDATSKRRGLKRLANRMPLALRPFARFVYIFIWRRGFLDGPRGFLYAVMMSVYEGMIASFVMDMTIQRRKPHQKPLPSRSSAKVDTSVGNS